MMKKADGPAAGDGAARPALTPAAAAAAADAAGGAIAPADDAPPPDADDSDVDNTTVDGVTLADVRLADDRQTAGAWCDATYGGAVAAELVAVFGDNGVRPSDAAAAAPEARGPRRVQWRGGVPALLRQSLGAPPPPPWGRRTGPQGAAEPAPWCSATRRRRRRGRRELFEARRDLRQARPARRVEPDALPEAWTTEFEKTLGERRRRPSATVKRVVSVLGTTIAAAFSTFDEAPLATASVAQVHAATLRNGDRVVVKVLKPGVRDTLTADLVFLNGAAKILEAVAPEQARVLADVAAQLRDSTLRLDLREEARRLAGFGASSRRRARPGGDVPAALRGPVVKERPGTRRHRRAPGMGVADGAKFDREKFAGDLRRAFDAVEANDAAAIVGDVIAVSEDNNLVLPSEFGLLTKQAVYLNRYVTTLAPDLDVFEATPRRRRRASGGGCASRSGAAEASFEDADHALRHALFDCYLAEGSYKEAACTLGGIDVETCSKPYADLDKAALYVKIAETFLEDDESVDAETYVNRASGLMHAVDGKVHWALQLRYRVTLERTLDARRKFLEASMRYYELSQARHEEVNQDDLLALLSKAVTCALLGNAGPQRSRILGLLYKDERVTSQMEQSDAFAAHARVLKRMFTGQVVRTPEIAAFTATLLPHQKALLGDGLTIPEKAMIQHNLAAVSLVYVNASLREVGALLDIDPRRAEQVASRMIADGRLAAKLDQARTPS
ncbi:hypothetical protein JL721_8408 [Aureococcus anophagefferens]|nr:hypothetical protein JL721_8408 [Aureococcus anophagefferens]